MGPAFSVSMLNLAFSAELRFSALDMSFLLAFFVLIAMVFFVRRFGVICKNSSLVDPTFVVNL